MMRSSLGADGEEQARRLQDAYELGSGFTIAVVTAAEDAALGEIRRRLGVRTKTVEIEPGPQLIAELYAVIAEQHKASAGAHREGDARPVIWIAQRRFEPAVWREGLAKLNQRRESLREDLSAMLIVAGPPELVTLLAANAPDFYANRMSASFHFAAAPTVQATLPRLRWLHLSDLHFRGDERWDRRALLTALLRAEKERPAEERPHFVFITGDVANSGNSEGKEYEQAERFFGELAEALELDPRKRFFIVPGNHDVDRSRIGPADAAILAGIHDQASLESVVRHPATMSLLGERLRDYYAFSARLLGPARASSAERPWRADLVELDGAPIGVLSLNSAWAAGTDADRGRLLLGEAQLRDALDQIPDVPLKIALMHHASSELRDWDEARVSELLQSPDGPTFLLRGHLHESRVTTSQSPDGRLIEIAAGTVYVEGAWTKACNRVHCDFEAGQVRVALRRYCKRGRGFWGPDSTSYEHAPDGVVSLELPPHLLTREPMASGAGDMSDAAFESHVERYRQVVSSVVGQAHFVGLPHHGHAPNVRVPELFVPLSFTGHPWQRDPAALAAALIQGKRVVVSGGAGSGKTTLCRFLVAVLAGHAAAHDIDLPAASPIPMFLPIRELGVQAGSLLDKLGQQAREQLALQLPVAFFERAFAGGRVVLLVDGLDEAGDVVRRRMLREQLVALCNAYPLAAVLATTRPAGYEEASLPTWARIRPGSDTADGPVFSNIKIEPLSDEQQDAFCAAWYRLREPDDPRARDRGVQELVAALAVERNARELGRNPLLLTLIALIHRSEARLPGRRVKLYEACVRTLLESWPAATRREFGEIAAEQQGLYLEQLALRMQEARAAGFSEVVISRDALRQALEVIIGADRTSDDTPAVAALVDRWIDHLEAGTGLLVEQQPNVFAFLHLSLMEFLAARALVHRHERQPLVDLILDKHDDPLWSEVCVLALALEADAKDVAQLFYEGLRSHDGPPIWILALRALREEFAFSDPQRRAVLDNVAKWATLHLMSMGAFGIRETVRQVALFSRRHGDGAKAWWRKRIAGSVGDELVEAANLDVGLDADAVPLLNARADKVEAAGSLLDLWPMGEAAAWAVAHTNAAGALRWASRVASNYLGVATWTMLSRPEQGPLPAALSLVLARAVRGPAGSPARDLMPDPHGAGPAATRLTRLTNLASGVGAFSDNRQYIWVRLVSELWWRGQAESERGDVDDALVDRLASPTPQRPNGALMTMDQAAWPSAAWVEPTVGETEYVADTDVIYGLVAAAERAVARSDGCPLDERYALVGSYLVARGQAPLWHEIDARLLTLDPYETALVLALGWTQYAMVGLWPATPGWIELLSAAPPTHWLPRAHWHQCWRTYDEGDATALEGLRSALEEGRADADLPGYAERFATEVDPIFQTAVALGGPASTSPSGAPPESGE